MPSGGKGSASSRSERLDGRAAAAPSDERHTFSSRQAHDCFARKAGAAQGTAHSRSGQSPCSPPPTSRARFRQSKSAQMPSQSPLKRPRSRRDPERITDLAPLASNQRSLECTRFRAPLQRAMPTAGSRRPHRMRRIGGSGVSAFGRGGLHPSGGSACVETCTTAIARARRGARDHRLRWKRERRTGYRRQHVEHPRHGGERTSPGALIHRSLPGWGLSWSQARDGRCICSFRRSQEGHVREHLCAAVAPREGRRRPEAGRLGARKAVAAWRGSHPEGGRVVTYAGRPLYTYIADSNPLAPAAKG